MNVFRRSMAACAALLLAASTVAACGSAGLGLSKATVTKSFSEALPADAAAVKVRVEMFNGQITVEPGGAGTISATVEAKGVGGSTAEAEADAAKIQVTLDVNPDGSVLLRAVYQPNPGSPNNRSASATVAVPPDAALDLRTSNGQVTTSGVAGPVDVRTSNGSVTLNGVEQGATVRTSNGSAEVQGSGLLDIETSNARILVRGTAATVNGRTSNGDVTFEGSFSDAGQQLETSNAPITVRLPASAAFALDAQTSNASVTLDGFEIRTTGAAGKGTLQGTVGTGGPSLTLRTSNAAIVVSAQ